MKKFIFILFLILSLGFVIGAESDFVYILKVDSYSTYPSSIYPNSEVSLNITLTNISELSDAKDIVATLYPNTTYFQEIRNTDTLNLIKFSQSGTVTLRFKVKNTTPGGYYSIPFKIEYWKKGEKFSIDTQVTLNVANYDKIDVVLDSYPKDKMYLNDELVITGKVVNAGNTTLKGVSVESSYGAEKLIPQKEISQFVGDIEPSSSKPFEFKFIIPKTADIGIYDMNISATDVLSNSDNEKLAFIVEDNPTLIISSIDKSIDSGLTYIRQNDYFSLSVQLENISKSKAKSVKMQLVDSDNIEGTTLTYVGSIDADDSGAGIFDLHIKPNANIGEVKLNLIVTYTDEYDAEKEFNREIPIFINEAKSSSFFGYIILILIIVSAGYYWLRKKRKNATIKNLK